MNLCLEINKCIFKINLFEYQRIFSVDVLKCRYKALEICALTSGMKMLQAAAGLGRRSSLCGCGSGYWNEIPVSVGSMWCDHEHLLSPRFPCSVASAA